jgi:mono/diheme cytochrome c family protein
MTAVSVAANAQSAANSANGKNVFEKVGCSRCHGSAGEGIRTASKEAGPPKIAGTPLSLRHFVESVRNPRGRMPPFRSKQVSDKELSDVYAYLHSPKLGQELAKLATPSSANPQDGQRLYVSFGCYECHGYEGQGSLQTGGSRIGPPQVPYSGFVAYVRHPTGQMPPYTSKAVSDSQLANIYVFLQSRPQAPLSDTIPLLRQ